MPRPVILLISDQLRKGKKSYKGNIRLDMSKAALEVTLRKAQQENWGTVNISDTTGNNPIDQLQQCEWALELNLIELSATSLFEASYGLRLAPQQANTFPLIARAANNLCTERKAMLSPDQTVGFGEDGMDDMPYVVYCEMALEVGKSITEGTKQRTLNRFVKIKYAAQAFPLLSRELGISGGPTFNPNTMKLVTRTNERNEVPLPPELMARIPEDHYVTRYTGTVEYIQTNRNNGQRNYYLHPIPGEPEYFTMRASGGLPVTDLPMEQINGHRAWIFVFLNQKTTKAGVFLAYSRNTEQWLTVHNADAMGFLINKQYGVGAKLAVLGGFAMLGGALGPTIAKSVAEKNRGITTDEIRQLVLDIRAFLVSSMEQPPPASSSGRL